jgi:CRP/FNR family transcriptional regulator, anaerobic regulatory protein
VTDSFLAKWLDQKITLNASEKAALRKLESNQRRIRRGSLLLRENEPTGELYILREGWVFSFMILHDGSRQILRQYFPGDMLGLGGLTFAESNESLIAVTDSVVGVFDKPLLANILAEHPRLGPLFFLLAQAERAIANDRLAAIGRTTAKARVGALLLNMLDRLRMLDPTISNSFSLPLTQEEIGDSVGLTAVHVNRMMRALDEDGLIKRSGNMLHIRDEARLIRISNYVNRLAALDMGWLAKG